MGTKGEAQKNYWYRQDEVLKACVKEIQERIQVNIIFCVPIQFDEADFCTKERTL